MELSKSNALLELCTLSDHTEDAWTAITCTIPHSVVYLGEHGKRLLVFVFEEGTVFLEHFSCASNDTRKTIPNLRGMGGTIIIFAEVVTEASILYNLMK